MLTKYKDKRRLYMLINDTNDYAYGKDKHNTLSDLKEERKN